MSGDTDRLASKLYLLATEAAFIRPLSVGDDVLALVEIAKAAREMFARNDDDTFSDEEVQETHDILRAALSALNVSDRGTT